MPPRVAAPEIHGETPSHRCTPANKPRTHAAEPIKRINSRQRHAQFVSARAMVRSISSNRLATGVLPSSLGSTRAGVSTLSATCGGVAATCGAVAVGGILTVALAVGSGGLTGSEVDVSGMVLVISGVVHPVLCNASPAC